MLNKLAHYIDQISNFIGKVVSWLALAMVLLMFFNVVQRYAFNVSAIWQHELVRYMHAILFLTVVGYGLLKNKHVRVDIFYQGASKRTQAWVDMVGVVLFLFPVSIAIIYFSKDFISSSWAIKEASPEYNGMPAIFILKTFLWVFPALLSLQGISILCKSVITIRGGKES